MKDINRKLSFLLTVALFIVVGCDGYHKRQVVINLELNPPKSFALVKADNLNKLLGEIKTIAEKNGMKCRLYNESERYFGCGGDYVNLTTYVIDGKTIKIEIIQFGPWGETKKYQTVTDNISAMLMTEFPGQGIQLIDPMKRQ